MKKYVQADKYALEKSEFDQLESFGIDVCPVDLNLGYVPFNKKDATNLDKTQHNIRYRFSLEEKDE